MMYNLIFTRMIIKAWSMQLLLQAVDHSSFVKFNYLINLFESIQFKVAKFFKKEKILA